MTSEEFQEQFNQAWSSRAKGNYDKVISITEQCLPLTRELGDQASEALFLKLYAQIHSDKGELEKSLAMYKQIEDIYMALGLQAKQMHTLRHIGMIYQELGKSECAEKCLKQVVDAYASKPPNDLEVANADRLYAITMESLGEVQSAIKYWSKAKALYDKVGIPEGVEECEHHLNDLSS